MIIANPKNYTSAIGKSPKEIVKFSFDNEIYGHETVKNQLKTEQYHKCCFCESKFVHIAHGDVEHFRPKTAYKKEAVKQYTYPGYYWLAYNWENLFFSCQICNQSYKKNEFPLIDESNRVTNHLQTANLSKEKPYLIDFLTENPADYIEFEKEIPKAKNDDIRGKKTIEITGIDRKDLNDRRLEYLEAIERFLVLLNLSNSDDLEKAATFLQKTVAEVKDIIEQTKTICKNAIKDEAEYAAMVRFNFPQLLSL